MTNRDSSGHDPFERHLQAGLAAEPAPDALHRRIRQIPLEHPRTARAGRLSELWSRLFGQPGFSAEAASWTTGLAAAAASLAIGLWLGFSGLAPADSSDNGDALMALVYTELPIGIGDEL